MALNKIIVVSPFAPLHRPSLLHTLVHQEAVRLRRFIPIPTSHFSIFINFECYFHFIYGPEEEIGRNTEFEFVKQKQHQYNIMGGVSIEKVLQQQEQESGGYKGAKVDDTEENRNPG